MNATSKPPLSYRDAGVDIEAGERLVETISPMARATARAGVMGGLGGFGALFDLKAAGYTDPVLVSGTDGVGTKLMLAFETGIHATVGIDLVAMCANDVLAQGAEPLFFLDYFATGKLEGGIAEAVIAGIAEGCRQSGCALVGGETAEMPGMYPPGHYDLAGFVVGAVDRDKVLPRMGDMESGDILIGIASSGPHSNGYSLIRRIVAREGLFYGGPSPFSDQTLGEALLTPTRLYAPLVMPLIRSGRIKGLAHITGGGLTENTPRMCPDSLVPDIDRASWEPLRVFKWLQEAGGVTEDEMHRTFNMGIGMVLAVSPADVEGVLGDLAAAGEPAHVIGALQSA
ncbi:MAG: phosphoribosylformylglycinamidine cyclo-ligase [Hyphomonas sp.]|uniref:phosphoribosylformylglycinamidine cyclo-ligase n=1 Tax=Hyphomonas sp. TaxID=87 RepID=UPI0017F89297|nr:phosphoribosylformylglycinamidine cyclo-ligase [Hyphomonas sp.]MBA3070072.1 phosphoribosylformylglycinamidine cyclo-ligase [Hyphomonas sp.]MBU4060352.1 phosphoribosylformylglycinamidine cyclo-ligase [Alphaproteobacteria bacterium]MBU4163020.1 phosphoribosylformylglycinamidine cyclo-ligase [Alphaproteobacteria bacterium]